MKRPDVNLAGKKRLPRNPPGFFNVPQITALFESQVDFQTVQ
jgi:hypothetical protein